MFKSNSNTVIDSVVNGVLARITGHEQAEKDFIYRTKDRRAFFVLKRFIFENKDKTVNVKMELPDFREVQVPDTIRFKRQETAKTLVVAKGDNAGSIFHIEKAYIPLLETF